ncbi:hypothetical protein PHYSODRAFT_523935, partial [Phytophthora sojae]
ATICRALKFELGLTRKATTKRAKENVPAEIGAYYYARSWRHSIGDLIGLFSCSDNRFILAVATAPFLLCVVFGTGR